MQYFYQYNCNKRYVTINHSLLINKLENNRIRLVNLVYLHKHFIILLNNVIGHEYELVTKVMRNMCVTDASLKLQIAEEEELINIILNNISFRKENIIIHLLWSLFLLTEDPYNRESVDLRIECVRLKFRGKLDLFKVIVDVIKSKINEEELTIANKLLSNLTKGHGK